MTYRIIKQGRAYHIAMDSLEDPPLSIIDEYEPMFMTLEAAVNRRNLLEDDLISMTPKGHSRQNHHS